ncbi:MAG: ATP synthase F1 subunit epsilon [Planctomycetia bacterium]|nr:ATP synthase F1 subunit epsilon [Planctomycetia bacterium]
MADSSRFAGIRCVIVTPEKTILDTTARGVILPLEDGRLGIGRGHAPFIGRLGAGEVRIATGDGREAGQRVFVDRGFVEVGHDTVTVVTQQAIPAEKLDLSKARASLAGITAKPATGDEAIDAKLAAQQAAREVVRIAGRVR